MEIRSLSYERRRVDVGQVNLAEGPEYFFYWKWYAENGRIDKYWSLES